MHRVGLLAIGLCILALPGCDEERTMDTSGFEPKWEQIAAWPGRADEGAANPDPDRDILVVVLDDSGSMSGEKIDAARKGVLDAIGRLDDGDRVALVALNAGVVSQMGDVRWARNEIAEKLPHVAAKGDTYLGRAAGVAYGMLEAEAAKNRGFGRYRILIATDGAANDPSELVRVVTGIVSSTPVDIATIGIGLGVGHVLNIPGFTTYVAVDRLEDLGRAMQIAAAEQARFDPITSFGETN